MDTFEKVFTVKKENTKEEFLRHVLISLTGDAKSPSNILEAKFGEVREFNRQVLVVGCDVHLSYSGSVGYDRREEYTEYEEKYDYSSHQTVRKPVKKTRIVTDWKPHSGSLETHEGDFCFNDYGENEYAFARLFRTAFGDAADESVVEEGSAVVNSSALRQAVEGCKSSARYSVRWPGDHHKDESYSASADITSLKCYIAPCYEVEFVYGGKTYKASGFAFGKPNDIHETPETSGTVQSEKSIREAGKAQIAREINAPHKVQVAGIVIGVIGGIGAFLGLFGLIGSAGYGLPLMIVGLVLLAIGIIIGLTMKKKINGITTRIDANTNRKVKDLANYKVNQLERILESFKLAALSPQEKASLNK